MAAMTTVLNEFSDNGNTRTYTTAGHTASKPKLVVSQRRIAENGRVIAENTVRISHATVDSDGAPISERVSMSVISRFPITGDTDDRDAVLAILRDFVAGDEFADVVATQNHPA